jgi:hypothetical protein
MTFSDFAIMKYLVLVAVICSCLSCNKSNDEQSPVTPDDTTKVGRYPFSEIFVGTMTNKDHSDDFVAPRADFDSSYTDTMFLTWLDTNHVHGRILTFTMFPKSSSGPTLPTAEYIDFSTKVDTPYIWWTKFPGGVLYFTGDSANTIHYGKTYSDSHGYAQYSASFVGTKH